MKNMKIIGKRSELGLTQADMSKKLGIALSTYNKKEMGKWDFTLKEAIQLMNIFNCKFEDIFLLK